MSVKVLDNRTVFNEADDATGWSLGAADVDVFVESPNAIIGTLNIAQGEFYFTAGAGVDLTNTLIYVWSNNFALQAEWDDSPDPPNAMHVGDGTNRISFKIAGLDKKVFTHLEDNDWGWDCLLLDTAEFGTLDTNGYTVARAGTFAGLDTSSITQLGADFNTLSKGLGGGTNVAVDIIRYGNDGLTISSGSSPDPGSFIEIVNEDKSTASLKAHGIIREYTTGLYGVQGPLTWGTGSENTYFSDNNVTVVFENRDIGDDKYYFKITGSTSVDTEFILDASTIATAGPFASLDFSSDVIRTLTITNCTFNSLSGSVDFANDTSGSFHTITNNSFIRPGNISIGAVTFENNSVNQGLQILVLNSGSLANTTVNNSLAEQGTGSLYWNVNTNPNTYLDGMSFTKGTTDNHAIEYGPNTPVTTSLTDVQFNSYGANDTSGSGIFNNSGKDLYISILGSGDTPTSRSAGGLTTTVVAGQITLTLTNIVSGSEVAIVSQSNNRELIAAQESIDTGENFTFTRTYVGYDEQVDIIVHALDYQYSLQSTTLTNSDQSIQINQIFDRNYDNPT